jgi:hypothetical protein
MALLGGLRQKITSPLLIALGIGAAGVFGMGFPALAEEGDIAVELNKLEPQGQACRAYLVVNNKSDKEYQSFNLDLVLFRPDGIINRRFALNLAPVKAGKRTVKLFDIDATPCDQVGSVLINDVLECKTAAGPVDDCLKSMSVSSLTKVQLTK